MGDRANVCVLDDCSDGGKIFLYTHWGGSKLYVKLAKALDRNDGWSDSSYLARIILDSMTELSGQTTGYGISTYIQDNDGYPILVVDCNQQRVFIVPMDKMMDRTLWHEGIPFADYVKEVLHKHNDPRRVLSKEEVV